MKTPEEVANRPVRSCACLEGNDGFCPIHGSITRDPDELLHDARMMEAEMKEERAPLTDQELEEIRGRLDEYGRAKAARVPLGSEGIDENLRFMAACDDLCNHAPADIAALLAEVRRLRGINQSLRNNQLEKYREYKAEKLRLEQALSAIERAMWDNNPTLKGARSIARDALEGK